ncbi:hypothetical protein M8J77_008523 [Diaphorina citri]|nr:hypothetical protein M8J77_008523 [Diaphorina citri]
MRVERKLRVEKNSKISNTLGSWNGDRIKTITVKVTWISFDVPYNRIEVRGIALRRNIFALGSEIRELMIEMRMTSRLVQLVEVFLTDNKRFQMRCVPNRETVTF